MIVDQQERMNEMWDEYFAKDDAVRERYASEVQGLKEYEESERWYWDYRQEVHDAGFGEDCDAYERSKKNV